MRVIHTMNKTELNERISLLIGKYRDDVFLGEEIQRLQQRIDNFVSSIVVVGQFSVGKSEFLNALLGEKLLVSRRVESTKVTTRIHKCDTDQQKKIILHFKNGETNELSINDVDTLDQYTTFQGSADTDVLLFVDIFWPLKLLNHEIILVDTPGANSLSKLAFKVTEKELENASSVLFLFNGQKGLDQIDLTLLMDLLNRRKKVFIIATHIDGITEEELASVLCSAQNNLAAKMNSSEAVKIYSVSSTEAFQAKQQGNLDLLKQSNITELEQALLSYVQNQEYLSSEIESIQYDLQKLETTIKELEEEERAELDERERQRKLRIERLQLLTKREYDHLKEYGFDLLDSREKSLVLLLKQWKGKIKENNSELKKAIARSFRKFRKDIYQELRFTTSSVDDLKIEYRLQNEKINYLYIEIINKFNELIALLYKYVERITMDEDDIFIENMEINKQNIQLSWPIFKQQVKQIVLNKRKIDYDKDLFKEYEQSQKELMDIYHKKAKKLGLNKTEQEKIEQEKEESLGRIEEDHENKIISIGKMPDPLKKKETKGFLWWKKEEVVGYDYSQQEKWKTSLQIIHSEYNRMLEEQSSTFKNTIFRIKMNEEKLISELDSLENKIDGLNDKLVDDFIKSIEDQKMAAQRFYKQMEEEIDALWKEQERDALQQFNAHTEDVRKQFIYFIEEGLRAELQLIK